MLIPMSPSEPDSSENPCILLPKEPEPEDQEELLDPDVNLHYYEFENLTFSRHNKVVNLKKLNLNLPKDVPFESQRDVFDIPLESSEMLSQIECEYNIDQLKHKLQGKSKK